MLAGRLERQLVRVFPPIRMGSVTVMEGTLVLHVVVDAVERVVRAGGQIVIGNIRIRITVKGVETALPEMVHGCRLDWRDVGDALHLDAEAHILDLTHLRWVDRIVERHVRRMRAYIRHPHVGQRDRIVLIRDTVRNKIIRVRGGDSAEQCARGHGQRGDGLAETSHGIPFS